MVQESWRKVTSSPRVAEHLVNDMASRLIAPNIRRVPFRKLMAS